MILTMILILMISEFGVLIDQKVPNSPTPQLPTLVEGHGQFTGRNEGEGPVIEKVRSETGPKYEGGSGDKCALTRPI